MIILTYDHKGFKLAQKLKKYFDSIKIDYKDVTDGCYNANDNFTEFGKRANKLIKKENFGIYICGTGIGMSIVANRQKGIRAGLVYNKSIAKLMVEHNNANVMVLPANYTTFAKAKSYIKIYMNSKFFGGKYQVRNEELDS